MARLGLDSGEKQIDIGRFLPPESKQDGISDYITIKRLSYPIKKKIETLSMNTMSGQTGKELFKYLKKSGKTAADIDKMSDLEKMEIVMGSKMTDDEAITIAKTTYEIAKATISNGIDPDKHTFIGMDDKPIKLTYEAIESIGNITLIEYLVDQINKLSIGYSVGE